MNKIIFFVIISSLIAGCKGEEVNQNNQNNNQNSGDRWLIPKTQIYDGGPGKDGIPSIDNPQKAPVDSIDFLEDDDLVIGFKHGNTIVAYPHRVLDWHEIANDQVEDLHVAITYCPLTGTASAWNRKIDGDVTEFGVSGLLYQNNLIPFDRNTESNWSQMLFKCVNGDLLENKAQTYPVFETTWKTWKELYPDSEVLTTETGYNRNYSSYPYQDYKTSDDIFYPIEFEFDFSLFDRKKRIHVVLDDLKILVFDPDIFENGTLVLRNNFEGNTYITIGNSPKNFYTSFQLDSNTEGLTFTPLINELPAVMEDNEGNKWTIFGKAITGPRKGDKLKQADQMIGYWFALETFYSLSKIIR